MTFAWTPVLPALLVAVTGVLVLLAQAFTPRGKRAPAVPVALAGLFAAATTVLRTMSGTSHRVILGDAVAADDFALFLQLLLLGVAMLAVLYAPAYLRSAGMERGEYYALLLFSVVGMLGLVSCLELISLFVALEIMSVSLYAMAGLRRDRSESQEAAVKYFVTGAFASAFFLYGVALLYGVSGSTALAQIRATVAAGLADKGMLMLGVGMLLVGFGFKVASAPFHMWTPDVYEGAPTTVTGFMSAGVKAAAFGAFLRVFGTSLAPVAQDWQPALAALAALTMVIGNLGALAQSNLKRMLAYSSIAHAGYLLTAFVAKPQAATPAVLFYLVGYSAVNLGGFGILAGLAKGGREPLLLDDLRGLAQRRPALAAAFTVLLISLTGVPVSAGFVGKFYLFSAAVSAGYAPLALLGVLMSVVSAYYYLGVVVAMYMSEPSGDDPWAAFPLGAAVALGVSVAVTLGLGVFPGRVLDLARMAAGSL